MALRAMYKGIKKVLAPLIINRPGELAIDQDALNTELNSVFFPRSEQAVLGAKNFWRGYISPDPAAGVTYTQNADKSISTSGSATGEESFGRLMTNADLIAFINANKGKTFVLNGCPSGGSHTTYYISIWANNGLAVEDDGSGATFTIPSSDCTSANIAIHIKDGVDISGKTWKPMISFDGGEYVPYAMTNKELTDDVATLNGSASDQKTTINAIITAATEAADFAAFKTAMGAITPVTRSIQVTPETREEITEPEEEPVKKTTRKKSTAKADTEKEGE